MLAFFAALVTATYVRADSCDARIGNDFCVLRDRIPCHDLSCQILNHQFQCEKGNTLDACAVEAQASCQKLPGCVAFGIYNHPKSGAHVRIEWYNATATSNPLRSPDWDYFFNETALGPPPPPPPQCVRGPSYCPAAPNGSVFPPPGDRPPGCNHKGCTTLPTLLPTWTPTYQMNKSSILMTCNAAGPTDPDSIKGWVCLRATYSSI